MLSNLRKIVTFPPKLAAPAAAPVVDPLAAIIAERDVVAASLTRFAKFDEDTRLAREGRERAHDALRSFAAEETAALRAWAESGGGEAPLRDAAKHAELVAALDQAERDLERATDRRATVQPAYVRVQGALSAIQVRLDGHRAEAIAGEALLEVDELAAIIEDAARRFNRIIAAREALYQQGWDHADRGAHDRAQPWLAAANRLPDAAPVTIDRHEPFCAESAAVWRAKIRE